ncbi:putative Dehydrogenase/reductase SDR family member 11 [Hypsibius exemplaris]|uniref:Dehydrogenase/reductase SDR family member 11 n=1 Tax=Hypsibius exemplaris TaxID=2072580 RepID=A0A1W0X6I6_HYPEX|nr:putative Dehydrogenase/reductase SDR family member 11 [Hypsibius exemplaris]
MGESLANKVVLVTGASSGIGAAICREFAKHGMIVVGAARREDRLKALESEIQGTGTFHGIRCDLTNEKEIIGLFADIEARFGGLDVCVNNAGIAKAGPILEGSTETWTEMLQLNVLATAICLRESVRLMHNRDSGHVIIVGSNIGHKVPPAPVMHFYSATKFAVRALADGLRQELIAEKSKVRVTHLAPGPVRTESTMTLFPNVPNINKILYKEYNPLEACDVAAAALYALTAPPNVNVNEIILNPIEGESIPRPKQFA